MTHNFTQDPNFNILTLNVENGIFTLTGETRETLDIEDYVNYICNKEGWILKVNSIVERRDSKDYPKGNGMFYKIECTPAIRPTI
jgi:hypothetical protein